MPRVAIAPEVRFWAKVNIRGPKIKKYVLKKYPELKKAIHCWEWTAACFDNGYGCFGIGRGDNVKAHRYAYVLKHGKASLDNNLNVLHKCDNKKCVRWAHLFRGTHQINMTDKCSKKRHSYGKAHSVIMNRVCARGSDCARSKLCVEEVKQIRKLYALGKYSLNMLAVKFSVSKHSILMIVHKKAWAHV
jgi:HNH endonuclease